MIRLWQLHRISTYNLNLWSICLRLNSFVNIIIRLIPSEFILYQACLIWLTLYFNVYIILTMFHFQMFQWTYWYISLFKYILILWFLVVVMNDYIVYEGYVSFKLISIPTFCIYHGLILPVLILIWCIRIGLVIQWNLWLWIIVSWCSDSIQIELW